MAVTTIDPALLQAADGKAENIREKIERCQKATTAIIRSFVILPMLRDMLRGLEDLRIKIGELEISTDEDREWAKEQAQSCLSIAKKIESAERKYQSLISTVSPLFGFITKPNLHLLDESYCLAEDAAETLALVANREFMESLEGDLRRIHGGA